MREFISKHWDKCLTALLIVILSVIIMNPGKFELIQITRLVRVEMKQMGYSNEAEVVVLYPTNQAGIYRASVPIQDMDGMTIEYWRMWYSRFLVTGRRAYTAPFYEYENDMQNEHLPGVVAKAQFTQN